MADSGNKKMWYFAFGSNMNTKILTGNRKVRPTQSKPAHLPGWFLNFDTNAIPYYEPSYASIGRTPIFTAQPEVHGVAHEITKEEYDRIRWTELGGNFQDLGYTSVEVTVQTYDGESLKAYTLIEYPRTIYHGQLYPAKRYMELLEGGSLEFGLKPFYQEWLKTLPRYEPIPTFRHNAGRRLFMFLAYFFWIPLMMPFWLQRYTGYLKSPRWMFAVSKLVIYVLCHVYHFVFLPIFGPGAGEPNFLKKFN